MLWLLIPGILLLLCIFPLGICAEYGKQGPRVYWLAWKVKIPLYPPKPKKEKPKKEKPKKERSPGKPSGGPPWQKEKGKDSPKPSPKEGENPPKAAKDGQDDAPGDFARLESLVRLVVPFLGDLRRKIRINRLQGYVLLAGVDPCDLAVNYGRAWAALGNLLPLLDRAFVIKKQDLQVGCDFAGEKTLFYGRAEITITVGRLLGLVLRYGWKLLKSTKMKKGGGIK